VAAALDEVAGGGCGSGVDEAVAAAFADFVLRVNMALY
jgi:hypothetical protein